MRSEGAPRIVLPNKWKAIVGDTLQLFYRGIIEHPFPYVYNIEVICDIGGSIERYFEVTPAADDIGEHKITFNLRDCDDNIISSASSFIEVLPEHRSPSSKMNILCVGDSLTESGIWVAELKRRLTSVGGYPEGKGLKNICFIGTRKNSDAGYEGYGGWVWGSYLVGQTYASSEAWIYCSHDKDDTDQHSLWSTEGGEIWKIETVKEDKIKLIRQAPYKNMISSSGRLEHFSNARNTSPIDYSSVSNANSNPFWDDEKSKVDISSYCKRHGFEGIDVVCFLLSWNGGGGFLEDAGRANIYRHIENAKKLIRIFHSQYPLAAVKLMGIQLPSLNGGCGSRYGAMSPYSNTYALCRYVFEMNIAYQALANEEEFASFVEFVNISSQFDSENNMPEEDKPVNLRCAKTEKVGTNGVHPKVEGYYQIADAMYRSITFFRK